MSSKSSISTGHVTSAASLPDVLTANIRPESPSLCSHRTFAFCRLAARPEISSSCVGLILPSSCEISAPLAIEQSKVAAKLETTSGSNKPIVLCCIHGLT